MAEAAQSAAVPSDQAPTPSALAREASLDAAKEKLRQLELSAENLERRREQERQQHRQADPEILPDAENIGTNVPEASRAQAHAEPGGRNRPNHRQRERQQQPAAHLQRRLDDISKADGQASLLDNLLNAVRAGFGVGEFGASSGRSFHRDRPPFKPRGPPKFKRGGKPRFPKGKRGQNNNQKAANQSANPAANQAANQAANPPSNPPAN